jgi:GNAT superfamily N-acetyltransferase
MRLVARPHRRRRARRSPIDIYVAGDLAERYASALGPYLGVAREHRRSGIGGHLIAACGALGRPQLSDKLAHHLAEGFVLASRRGDRELNLLPRQLADLAIAVRRLFRLLNQFRQDLVPAELRHYHLMHPV